MTLTKIHSRLIFISNYNIQYSTLTYDKAEVFRDDLHNRVT